jgi:hypothetical protein
MKAAVNHGIKDVRVENVPDSKIKELSAALIYISTEATFN